jgi:hypothetical protein
MLYKCQVAWILLLLISFSTLSVIAYNIPIAAAQNDNANFLTYTNTNLGFTIRYPSNWTVNDRNIVNGHKVVTITIRLYDSSQCPPPDSQGRINFGSCNIMFNQDYSTGDKIDKYIPHGGKFYLYLQDSSPFFNKVVTGNIYVEYLPQ